MATGSRNDPYRGFNFRVEIDGITQAGFQEVSGLDTSTDAVDYREGTDPNHTRKLTGLNKFAAITQRWVWFLIDRLDRARAQPRRCGRVCWRARSPACCGASVLMPARSRATERPSLPAVVVSGQHERPVRTAFSGICCRAWRFFRGSCDLRWILASVPAPAMHRSRVPA